MSLSPHYIMLQDMDSLYVWDMASSLASHNNSATQKASFQSNPRYYPQHKAQAKIMVAPKYPTTHVPLHETKTNSKRVPSAAKYLIRKEKKTEQNC